MAIDTTGRRLQTIETGFDILETIQTLDGARLSEVAEQLNMAESTVHGYLGTLLHRGFVVKKGDTYHVGLKFLDLGGHARERKKEYGFAEEKTKELARETKERAQFIVEEHGRGIHVYTETGSQAVQINARIGKMNYLHASAAGKAILAHGAQETVENIIDKYGLPEFTENTITSREKLYDELQAVRDRGYSFNDQESTEGLRAVGVPIQDDEQVHGALSISAPSNRLQGETYEETIPNLLLGAANELELKIKYEQ